MSQTIPLDFEWTPTFDAERVYLHIGGVHNHHDPRLNTMHLDADGRWRDSVNVPDNLRASYRIVPVDARTASAIEDATDHGFDLRSRWMKLAEHVVDGDNSRPHRFPSRTVGESGRIVMPSAPAAPGWDARDVQTSWDEAKIAGRRVFLSGPEDAEELLVLFDAHRWLPTSLDPALRRLHEAGSLPSFRVLAVDTEDNRVPELSRSKLMRDYIANQLLPSFSRYSPAHRVISGQSLGGLTSLDIALTRPGLFHGVVSNSGSFWFPRPATNPGGSIAADLREGGALALHNSGTQVFLTVGHNEGMDMEVHNPAVAQELAAAGVDFRLEMTATAHEMAAWEGGLTRGLVWLYR